MRITLPLFPLVKPIQIKANDLVPLSMVANHLALIMESMPYKGQRARIAHTVADLQMLAYPEAVVPDVLPHGLHWEPQTEPGDYPSDALLRALWGAQALLDQVDLLVADPELAAAIGHLLVGLVVALSTDWRVARDLELSHDLKLMT